MHREGAKLAFAYQGEKLKERVTKMANRDFNSDIVIPCDVSRDEDITELFKQLNVTWDGLDSLVHSVAYAPAEWPVAVLPIPADRRQGRHFLHGRESVHPQVVTHPYLRREVLGERLPRGSPRRDDAQHAHDGSRRLRSGAHRPRRGARGNTRHARVLIGSPWGNPVNRTALG